MTVGVALHPDDNVATMLEDLKAGCEATVRDRAGSLIKNVRALDDIKAGHKIALVDIMRDDLVRKYGESIGRATAQITAGRWVHTHNVESQRGRGDLAGGGERGRCCGL